MILDRQGGDSEERRVLQAGYRDDARNPEMDERRCKAALALAKVSSEPIIRFSGEDAAPEHAYAHLPTKTPRDISEVCDAACDIARTELDSITIKTALESVGYEYRVVRVMDGKEHKGSMHTYVRRENEMASIVTDRDLCSGLWIASRYDFPSSEIDRVYSEISKVENTPFYLPYQADRVAKKCEDAGVIIGATGGLAAGVAMFPLFMNMFFFLLTSAGAAAAGKKIGAAAGRLSAPLCRHLMHDYFEDHLVAQGRNALLQAVHPPFSDDEKLQKARAQVVEQNLADLLRMYTIY